MPVVVGGMGEAALKSNMKVVREATEAVGALVAANGARFHIRGRSGTKVPLGARTDVKVYHGKPVGAVRGTPAGFWQIVEHGSAAHLIVGTTGQNGKKRSLRANLSRFEAGELGSGTKPLTAGPYGYKQWVMHPGHGPIGRPWETAMAASYPVAERILAVESFKAFVQTWT
jgi:hypothetical protein